MARDLTSPRIRMDSKKRPSTPTPLTERKEKKYNLRRRKKKVETKKPIRRNIKTLTGSRVEAAAQKEISLAKLKQWLDKQLTLGSAPRTQDIIEHSLRSQLGLSRGEIRRMVRLDPSYVDNSHQQRDPLSSRKERPILTNTLGMLHCDLAFFPVVREYKTPKTFRHGFLVAKDILSRYTYIDLLKASKTAKTLVKSLKRIFHHHDKVHPDYPVLSLAWDKEPGMRSEEMRVFLKERHIKRVFFQESRSKSKMAENCIRLIRTKAARLMKKLPKRMWWRILPRIMQDLNEEEIVVGGKRTGYSPRDIDTTNVRDFIRKLQKAVPAYYFSQFKTVPSFVKFRFNLGDIVRAKSVLASSQVLGTKRSQLNLQPQTYEIVLREPFTTKDLHNRPLYRCRNTHSGDIEIFSEQDIALVAVGPSANVRNHGEQ